MTTEEPLARGETVLVVEDDKDLRRFVVTVLSRLGYEVLEASSGKRALAVLKNSPEVDLVLSDVLLPGGRSGPDIAEEAQRHRPDLKFLFMSGYVTTESHHQGWLRDWADLLNKPFTKRDLAQRVRAVLDS